MILVNYWATNMVIASEQKKKKDFKRFILCMNLHLKMHHDQNKETLFKKCKKVNTNRFE